MAKLLFLVSTSEKFVSSDTVNVYSLVECPYMVFENPLALAVACARPSIFLTSDIAGQQSRFLSGRQSDFVCAELDLSRHRTRHLL